MKVLHILIVVLCLSFVGCEDRVYAPWKEEKKAVSQSAIEQSSEEKLTENSFQPFYIYSDKGSRANHFVPSGFMPDGKCLALNDRWQEDCQSGRSCIRVVYDVECSQDGQSWSGIYWLNPPNNWGNRKVSF